LYHLINYDFNTIIIKFSINEMNNSLFKLTNVFYFWILNLIVMERFKSDKISAEDVAIVDNNSQWLGIPLAHLMECAGYSIAMELIERYNLKENDKIAIFCGTGNNGGDGFVVARHLSAFNVKSVVFLLGIPEKIRTSESRLNWDIISKNLEISIETVVIKDSTGLSEHIMTHDKCKDIKLLVDGLLGTGVKGKIREPMATAIELINSLREQFKIPVISIDLPSGMDPNTGEVLDKAVKADLVIALHRIKKGVDIDKEYIQEIIIKSIGIPEEAHIFTGIGDLIPTLKNRNKDNHKGQFGRLLVIGGSKNYSGAPAYCALTGIHFGCDLVITYVPEFIGDVLRSYSPNMIVRTNPGDWLNTSALEEILWLIDWSNSIIIGPGLGEQSETEKLLVKILEHLVKENKKFVLDADALKLVKNHLDIIKGSSAILTPHEGELKIMTGVDLPSYDNIVERRNIISNLAKKLDITLLVKGPYDYISDGKKLKINRTGCPEMSIGGTGDVLAGLCGCFLTTGNNPFNSACSAAFLNGVLGEYVKNHIGPRFTTTDMIDNINKVIIDLMDR
jgi:NAD(P)H-hydrate epimerase